MTAFAEAASAKDSSQSTDCSDHVKGDIAHSTDCDSSLGKSESDGDQNMNETCDDSNYLTLRKNHPGDQMKNRTDIRRADSEEDMYSNCEVSDDDQALIERFKYVTRSKPKSGSPDITNVCSSVENGASEESEGGNSIEPTKVKLLKLNIQRKHKSSSTHHKHKKHMKRKHSKKSNKHTKLKPVVQTAEPKPARDLSEDDSSIKACPICDLLLLDSHSFTLHIREHNTNKQSHTCQICSKKLSSASSLDRHMYVHSGERPFKCTICNIAFTTNGNMHRHMRTHSMKLTQTKTGKDAGSTKENHSKELAVVKRKLFGHDSETESSPPKKAAIEISTDENLNESLTCPVCGKKFFDISCMQLHMKGHPNDPIMCRKCNEVTENYWHYTKHICPGHEKADEKLMVGFRDLNFIEFSSQKFSLIAKNVCEGEARHPSSSLLAFECRTCSKAFPCRRTLHCHEAVHSNDIGTYCHTCKCNFASSKSLQRHQLKHRSAEQCDKSITTEGSKCNTVSDSKKEDFLAILELRNKGMPASPTEKCENDIEEPEMQAMDSSHLDDIKSIPMSKQDNHTETSNDFADITSIISLTSKTIIPNIRASPLTAAPASPPQDTIGPMPDSPVIEGSANSAIELQSIPDTPPPTQETENNNKSDISCSEEVLDCNECEAQFSNTNALKRHKRTHGTGGQTYSCKTCSYQSVDRSTLMRHLRTHNGERPFKCSICDYAFTTKANSHRHVKKKHKLPDNEVADAVVYNPNMLESSVSENIPSDINSTETVCKYCNHDFKYNRVLRHHLRSLNNSCSRKPYACKNCKLGFSTKNNCIRHISNQHPEFKDKLKDLIVVNGVVENSESEPKQDLHEESREEDEEKMDSSDEADEPLNLKLGISECPSPCPESVQKMDTDDADRVSVAESLVSLSELLPPQENPLDLSLHALDLTAKSDIESPMPVQDKVEIIQAEISQAQTSPLQLTVEVKVMPSKHVLPPVVPMNSFSSTGLINLSQAVAKPKNGISSPNVKSCNLNESQIKLNTSLPVMYLPKSTSVKAILPKTSPVNLYLCSPVNSITIPVNTVESIILDKNSHPDSKMDKEKIAQNPRSYQCNYCAAMFTLKSNKERHIKKKHPEHARPTRSRNFIPTLSSTEISKQTSTLSDKTRDALRVVLSTKVNSSGGKIHLDSNSNKIDLTIERVATDACDSSLHRTTFGATEQLPFLISAHAESEQAAELDIKSDSENADLASVSSVINTANSQAFKQYLNGAKDVDSSEKEEMDTPLPTWSYRTDSDGDTCTEGKQCKKSSYSKSKKNVPCNYCENSFPWQSSLQRHVLTHTGHKPHKCPKCPVRFTTKSNRDRHLYRKHKGADTSGRAAIDRPFKCGSCPSSCFSTQGTLKKHFYLKRITKASLRNVSKMSSDELNENSESDANDVECKAHSSLSCDNSERQADCSFMENCVDDKGSNGLENICNNSSEDIEDDHDNNVHPSEHISQDRMSPSVNIGADTFDVSMSQTELCVGSGIKSNSLIDVNESKNGIVSSISFSCCFCLKTFNCSKNLNDHIGNHADPEQSSVSCKICNESFSADILSIQNHQMIHLKNESLLLPISKKSESLVKNLMTIKTIPNSLLYLIAAVEKIPAAESQEGNLLHKDNLPNSNENDFQNHDATDTDSNLIMDLLGVEDPQIIDDMLDSAARTRVQNSVE